jgi:16S rRNA (cytosine1402-N4)-methyltransferase
VHVPILLKPIADALTAPFSALGPDADPHWILDCTLGGGGHTGALLRDLAALPGGERHGVIALDRDPTAVSRAQTTFEREISEGRLIVHHCRISEFRPDRPVLGILADLGVSSDQIDRSERGFSFQSGEPLDMRMDPTRGLSVREVLARTGEKELADLIYELGEERFSRRIASAIVRARQEGTLPSTGQELGELIRRAVPPPARRGRIHPATRSFQALRIHVNQELDELDCFLRQVILELKPGGRAAVLSFHSLEDRMVKNRFRQLSQHPGENEGEWKLLTKKPMDPSDAEIEINPRSRSAHLRMIERRG